MEKHGNLLVAQSGGPSMVINQSLAGVAMAARTMPAIGAIYGARHGIRGILEGDTIDLRGISPERMERIAGTPSSALGSVRMKPTPEECAKIFARLRALDVRWFFYIGGNDSAETAAIIGHEAEKAGEELVCFHVPKI